MKVIITTSGIGSRLKHNTECRNKSLVRVGDKPAISHIIDNYPSATEFVITLGYYGQQVKDYLEIAYPDGNFEFVNVERYSGIGSSLGYSLLHAKDKLNCPFVFHACDTLVFEPISSPTYNWCGVFDKMNSCNYRKVTVCNSFVTCLNDKEETKYDYEYIGLCGIYDYKMFWTTLQILYESNPNNKHLSDVDVINIMLQNHCYFRYNFLTTWRDIGTVEMLQKTRSEIRSNYEILAKHNEDIFFINNHTIKFFSDEDIVDKRVKRAKLNLNDVVPCIVDHKPNFYKYKYVKGKLVSKVYDTNVISRLLQWCQENLWKPIDIDKKRFNSNCHSFYIEKTKKRILDFLEIQQIEDSYTTINGVEIKPVLELLKDIKIENHIPTVFHGDFILDNVLETEKGFKLLDWRHDFDGEIEYGDLYYDLSKLYHNTIINHEAIHKELFKCEEKDGQIFVDVFCKYFLQIQKNILEKFIQERGYDLNKVRILSSLIWLNMSPLHEKSFGKFIFYFGKYNLYLNTLDSPQE